MSDRWSPGHDGRPRREPTPAEAMRLPASQRDRVVTPDGAPLAPWWRRLVAYWIDALLVGVVVQAMLLPLQLLGVLSWVGPTSTSLSVGVWLDVGSDAWSYLVLSVVATLVASACYSIAMLTRIGWTLGKRLLGIRVRHREHERLPNVSEAARRWAVQLAPAAVSGGVVGALAGLWIAIDGLRPLLWDERRQAFHDSAAGTSVVLR
ncbi:MULTISPECIES: RDD family protein [unclassified Agrococcus]|uniref:RDD family protein n=1 Tax=unclassified Agrococcus TaxID=2615065 RepID=UPI003614634D